MTGTAVTGAAIVGGVRAAVHEYLAHDDAPPGVAVAVVAPGLGAPGVGAAGVTVCAGTGSESTGLPVDSGTRFCIGSVTKLFTAALTGYAGVTDRAALGDPVLPLLQRIGVDLPAQVPLSEVTLLQLATHTSGMANLSGGAGYPLFEDEAPQPGLIDYWRHGYRLPPGGLPAPWLYSDRGFVTLGFAVPGLFGDTSNDYADLLAGLITGPLGMSATEANPTGDRACGYTWSKTQGRAVCAEEPPDLWSCAGDLLTFLRVNLGVADRPVPGALTAALGLARSEQGRYPVHGHPNRTMSMGLAWQRPVTVDGRQLLTKSGGVAGFTCDVQLEPAAGVGVAVLTNQSWASRADRDSARSPIALAGRLRALLEGPATRA